MHGKIGIGEEFYRICLGPPRLEHWFFRNQTCSFQKVCEAPRAITDCDPRGLQIVIQGLALSLKPRQEEDVVVTTRRMQTICETNGDSRLDHDCGVWIVGSSLLNYRFNRERDKIGLFRIVVSWCRDNNGISVELSFGRIGRCNQRDALIG